ncbi:hypothetical protein Poly21_27040 [Allorhodopirellula heiligendammensis]|uniref:Uncharacterized protein n=1 Tax=Allorhodopirellula heiligendammensis TaxID=2714739 RepID=A0A5C6BV29_9BACT|nr:hypothetical protein Poly21_27040 [Allorhodopirellula heiligendammensis]
MEKDAVIVEDELEYFGAYVYASNHRYWGPQNLTQ